MTPSSADYDYIRRLVQDHSAIMLETGKEYLLGLRLQGLLTRRGCADIAARTCVVSRQTAGRPSSGCSQGDSDPTS